ncbi:MAG: four helix bundle protein, partial [Planctomycetota bacterium]
MHDFKRLRVWILAADLAADIYEVAATLPQRELFGSRTQLERAVVSISANIAEGRLRGTDREFIRFLRIALGSTGEVESLVLVGQRLGYFSEQQVGRVTAALGPLRGSLI